jgi:hypothetical protein
MSPDNEDCLYCGHIYENHAGSKEDCDDVWCCCECSGPTLSHNSDKCYCSTYRPLIEHSADAIKELQRQLSIRDWNLRERGKIITQLMDRIKELENANNSNQHTS